MRRLVLAIAAAGALIGATPALAQDAYPLKLECYVYASGGGDNSEAPVDYTVSGYVTWVDGPQQYIVCREAGS